MFKYSKTLRYFGEDVSKTKFEDFFGMWNCFLVSFNETSIELKLARERKENEQKQKNLKIFNTNLRSAQKQIQMESPELNLHRHRLKSTSHLGEEGKTYKTFTVVSCKA